MSDSTPDARRRFTRRLQFNLGTLLLATAATSLFLAMWAWRGERGVFECCLAAPAAVILAGVYHRSVRLVLLGLLLLAGVFFGLRYSAENTSLAAFTVSMPVQMQVRVVDASTGQPISGAKVRLPSAVSQPGVASTAGDGTTDLLVELPCTVWRYRSLLLSRTERRVLLRGIMLRVEAEGRKSVLHAIEVDLGAKLKLQDDRLPEITVFLHPE